MTGLTVAVDAADEEADEALDEEVDEALDEEDVLFAGLTEEAETTTGAEVVIELAGLEVLLRMEVMVLLDGLMVEERTVAGMREVEVEVEEAVVEGLVV